MKISWLQVTAAVVTISATHTHSPLEPCVCRCVIGISTRETPPSGEYFACALRSGGCWFRPSIDRISRDYC
uniref:Putative secreted protein n=1 Tax=Anopheles marajoara TaxID=58244 RepID=A0A2M4CET0_9DIPT